MKRRIIETGFNARQKLAEGARKLAEAVASTVGPFGENYYLDKKDTITNDGVTIAREFQLLDEVENRGVKAIREAAIKTVDQAGDGTSTATVLAYEFYKAASRFLGKEGVVGKKTPSEIGKQLKKETEEVIEKLRAVATPITSEEELIKSAIVSTEDEELGTLIGRTQWELGPDGVLLAEDANGTKCEVERVKGIRLDNGFGSSGVVNNQEKWQLEVENCSIILTTHTIKTRQDWMELMKPLEKAMKAGVSEIVVIARAWTDETLNYCLQNLNAGALKVYPLNAPYINMTEVMKDLAAVTGATFYDAESSQISDIFLSGIGRAKKVIGRRMESYIEGVETDVSLRVAELKKQQDGSESDFEKKELQRRIAQLENGFALIKIASLSQMEKRRLLDKADDAINAVKAALQEGTIRGAGIEAKEIAETLPDSYIVKRPLMAIHDLIKSSAPEGFVVEDWVRDPLKVWRCAITNAATSAATLATAGGVITEAFPKPLEELFGKQAASQE